jgi:SAM-dependent methyltransferase/uncharacterized protein YbaR (Trm112 family)
MKSLDPWYLENLVCPVSGESLKEQAGYLTSPSGRRYPIANGIPVMLIEELPQTIGVARASIDAGNRIATGRQDEFCVESLGLTETERHEVACRIENNPNADPDVVASFLIGATSGYAYENLIGKMNSYPIPAIAIKPGRGQLLLDIGCNWGRWSIASARLGYQTVGIDPSLGAVLAARRIAQKEGLDCRFVVGDGRFLPFRPNVFDTVYSFSVLQHFSDKDATKTLKEVGRVLRAGGNSCIQMPNAFGLRCLWHQIRRGFRPPTDFEVRYFSIPQLQRMFEAQIGATTSRVHCFFGIGLLPSDFQFMGPIGKLLIVASEALRVVSFVVPPIKFAADSVYLESRKSP